MSVSGSYLTKEEKEKIIKDVIGEYNPGMPEAQIALWTYRIRHLTEHLRQHPKDYRTLRALKMLVGKRRRMLNYLKRKDFNRYRNIVHKLGLRG